MFSGLYRLANGDDKIPLMTYRSRCNVIGYNTRRSRETNSRLQIDQDGAGNIVLVICLVEEDIFAVATLRREVLQIAILVDAMLLAE